MFNFILLLMAFSCIRSEASPKSIDLKTLLDFQFKDENQKNLIDGQATDQSQQLAPAHSLWLTDINSTFELQNNITEKFTGRPVNTTESLPLEATISQSTPYGVSLNLEYYREMGDPSFQNFFNQERYRGSLEFSLLRDPLGQNSRRVVRNLKKSSDVFLKKVEADQCRDISQKYNEVLAYQKNIEVIDETLENSKSILRGLKKAARQGAVNKTTVSVMSIDIENLKAQRAETESNKIRGLIELQNLSGYSLDEATLESFKEEPEYTKKVKLMSLQIKILRQEISSLKAQLSKLNLDRNHDLSLYTGLNSSKFAQNVLNLQGGTDFSFFGIRANLRLSDQDYKVRKNRLKAQTSIKENELRIASRMLEKEHQGFINTLTNFSSSYTRLKDGINNLKQTEARTFKNFRNGKSTYNDYLTSRNEIFRYKQSLIKAQESFWNTVFDYEHFKGDTKSLCLKGRIL